MDNPQFDTSKASDWARIVQNHQSLKLIDACISAIKDSNEEVFLLNEYNNQLSSYAELFVKSSYYKPTVIKSVAGISLYRYSGVSILISLVLPIFACAEHHCCIDNGEVTNAIPLNLSILQQSNSTIETSGLSSKVACVLTSLGYNQLPISYLSLPYDGEINGEYPFDHDGLTNFDLFFQNIY